MRECGSLKLAFLGCGYVTRLHSRTLARLAPDVRRVYASRGAARARELDGRFGGAGWYNSYEAALADPTVDVAVIATPPGTHLQLALAALAAGKDVVVEKPAFPWAEDCDTAGLAAERAGRRLLVAENYFYKPLAERLRAVIASGVLGEIRFVHVNALKRQIAQGWRAHAELAGGGALFEGGIHWIDLMANLGPTAMRVRGFRPGAGRDPAHSALVVIEYAEGAVGVLSYSWEIASPMGGVRISRIYGTAGSAAFESNGLFLLVIARGLRLVFPGVWDLPGYGAMWSDFLHALRSGPPPRFTLEHARRDIELARQAELEAEPITCVAEV